MIPSEPSAEFTPSGFDYEFASPADYARLYRLRGIQVVPAFMPGRQPEGESWKRPLLKTWTEYQEALIPDELFEHWYGSDGQFVARENMGALTGRASNNLLVIDLDDYKNLGAKEWWNDLIERENNRIEPETVEQRTGGGGRQKIFRAPPGWVVPNKNIHSMGIDIKGQGGFVMLPPSLHESGKHYEWAEGQSPDDIPIATAEPWLIEAVEKLVAEHGGTPAPSRKINGQAPQEQYDGFAHLVDGRETYMRDMVWAAVLNWNAECPLPVSASMSLEQARKEYAVYEREVNPQGAYPPDVSKTDALDHEGRGWKAWWDKWQRAMRKWDGDVYREARKPGRHPKEGPTVSRETIVPVSDPTIGKLPPIALRPAFPIVEGEIPVRDWVIPGLLLRRNLSVLVAPPASGKSLLTLQLAIAVALGMAWGGWHPRAPQKVLVINAEDDFDEMQRRLFAAAKSMGINQADLVDRVFLADAPESIVIARMDSRTKSVIRTPLADQLVTTIEANGIGMVIADPFAETFEGDENSNSEVKWAGILWREVARRTGCSLLLVHHTKKYAGDMAGVADASRGGGALIGTARILCTLFTMTEDEAKLFNIPVEERDEYVRFDDAKANHSAKGKVKWFRKVTVSLANGNGFVPGDDVGVLQPWKPPGVMDGVTSRELGLALESIGRGVLADDGKPTGQLYGPTVTSKDRWAGRVLERLLDIPEDRAKAMIKAWLESGVLYTVEYDDPQQRKVRTGVKFDSSKRPDEAPKVFD